MRTYYRVYANSKKFGWEKIEGTTDKDKAFKSAESLSYKEYYSYVIIANSGEGDDVIDRKDLSKECTVEFVDDVKSKIEVKATTFKPSRMKRKQEERKMFEQYIDR